MTVLKFQVCSISSFEKKIFEKVNAGRRRTTTDDDGRIVMTIAHMDLRSRWANKKDFYDTLLSSYEWNERLKATFTYVAWNSHCFCCSVVSFCVIEKSNNILQCTLFKYFCHFGKYNTAYTLRTPIYNQESCYIDSKTLHKIICRETLGLGMRTLIEVSLWHPHFSLLSCQGEVKSPYHFEVWWPLRMWFHVYQPTLKTVKWHHTILFATRTVVNKSSLD